MGWEQVADALDDVLAHPGPVVTSYSVCDPFPEKGTWAEEMTALRENQDNLQLHPSSWKALRFGKDVDYFKLGLNDPQRRSPA